MDINDLVASALSVNKLQIDVPSQQGVINAYWTLKITLPSKKEAILALVEYSDVYESIIIPDYTYAKWCYENETKYENVITTLHDIHKLKMPNIFIDVTLQSDESNIAYDNAKYQFNVASQCNEITITSRGTGGDSFNRIVNYFFQLAISVKATITNNELDSLILVWSDYVKLITLSDEDEE